MRSTVTLEPAAMVGRVVGGRYTLEAVLGAGGMGAVFRARHAELGTSVAVKLLLSEDAEHTARFEREAAVLARIDHRSVVRVLDFGRDGEGFLFLAMEHVSGVDLQRISSTQGVLPLERVVALGADVLAGLAAAHDAGVIHRDLKPSNVLITRTRDDEGRVRELAKLCDFGIASTSAGAAKGNASEPLTQTGFVVGTPDYMAPEQALGRTPSVRTDLYAVGVMLFELATASRPFRGSSALEVAMQHVSGPIPRPSARVPVPASFDALCVRAMSKEPEDRFEDARAMRRALLDVLRGADEVASAASAATVATPKVHDAAPAPVKPPSTDDAVTLGAADAVGDPPAAAPRTSRSRPWFVGAAVVGVAALGVLWRTSAGEESLPQPRVHPERVTVAASGSSTSPAPSRPSAALARATRERPGSSVVAVPEETLATPRPSRAIVVRSRDPVEPASGGVAVAAASPKSGALAPAGDPSAGIAAATLPNTAPTAADALVELRRALGSVTRVQAGPGLAETDVSSQAERARRALEQCTMRGAAGLRRGDLGEIVARLRVSPEGKVQGVSFDDPRWPEPVRSCAQRALVGLYLPHALPNATSAIIGLGLVLD